MALIRNDLETSVNTHNYEVIDEFLNDALDLVLHVSVNDRKQLWGFDIGITTGGPNITLEFTRGRCELVGQWGYANLRMNVDRAVCEEILERLEELSF